MLCLVSFCKECCRATIYVVLKPSFKYSSMWYITLNCLCDILYIYKNNNSRPCIRFLLPMWMGLQCVVGSDLVFGLTEACPHSSVQGAWGSNPWLCPSICLSSFAKLQGTIHYGVILLIGPLSSPPHSCRAVPYSLRMEYACKPPPRNCSTRALAHTPMWKLRLGNIVLSS